jgi:hypothetical protein
MDRRLKQPYRQDRLLAFVRVMRERAELTQSGSERDEMLKKITRAQEMIARLEKAEDRNS